MSLLNESHAIFDGRPPWAKVALSYITPIVVASLGYSAARRLPLAARRRNVGRLVSLLDRDDPPRRLTRRLVL